MHFGFRVQGLGSYTHPKALRTYNICGLGFRGLGFRRFLGPKTIL